MTRADGVARRVPTLVGALVLWLIALTPASGQPAPESLHAAIGRIDAMAAAEHARDGVGSVTVGVVHGPALVWTRSYGLADAERGIAATKDTVYHRFHHQAVHRVDAAAACAGRARPPVGSRGAAGARAREPGAPPGGPGRDVGTGDDRRAGRHALRVRAGDAVPSASGRLDSGYGVGFQLARRGDHLFLGHGGSVAGYMAQAWIHRASRTGIIVLRSAGGGRFNLIDLTFNALTELASAVPAKESR